MSKGKEVVRLEEIVSALVRILAEVLVAKALDELVEALKERKRRQSERPPRAGKHFRRP